MQNVYMDDVRVCPYVGYITVRTIEETMLLLEAGAVNRCSLDHDMGACKSCTSQGLHEGDCLTNETTFMNWCPHALDGTKLVRWMMTTGFWPKQKPDVHSANPAGRERMRALIDKFYGQPALGPIF